VELSFFLDTETLFPVFGLPLHLDPPQLDPDQVAS
jgi:hypothetical protein